MSPVKILLILVALGLALTADYLSLGHVMFGRIKANIAQSVHARLPGHDEKAKVIVAKGQGDCSDEDDDDEDDDDGNDHGSFARQDLVWPDDSHSLTINVPIRLNYRPNGPKEFFADGPAQVTMVEGALGYKCGKGVAHPMSKITIVTLSGVMIDHFSLAGASQVDLVDVQQPTLSVSLSGAGLIDGSGRAEQLDISVAGAGKVDLGELMARTAKISLAGASDARLAVQDRADVSVAGIGHVHWTKRPAQVNAHIAGLGKVEDSEDR